MSQKRIKLIIEYNGAGYHGWQIQKNAHAIQEEMEQAIFKITGEKVRVTGAGRTDAGVHAYGQVAHFDTSSKIPACRFGDAINAVLPEDVAVVSSKEVPHEFHARFSATGKVYHYRIINRRSRSPIWNDRAWHVRQPLDLELMERAATYYIGTHNFSSFCSSGHSVSAFERTITDSGWIKDGDGLVYRVYGNGFLYNMVRIMTGTMVEIGLGKRMADSIPDLLAKKDRNAAGITAPPWGLYLVRVDYG